MTEIPELEPYPRLQWRWLAVGFVIYLVLLTCIPKQYTLWLLGVYIAAGIVWTAHNLIKVNHVHRRNQAKLNKGLALAYEAWAKSCTLEEITATLDNMNPAERTALLDRLTRNARYS